VLNVLSPFCVLLSGVFTLVDLAEDPPGSPALEPLTAGMYGLTGAIILVDVGAHVARIRQRAEAPILRVRASESAANVARAYHEGEAALAVGNLTAALRAYETVLNAGGDSPLHPQALFRAAKIHSLLGRPLAAVAGYQAVVSQFPVVDLHDLALKNLADMYVSLGHFGSALSALELIVFADATYSREELTAYAASVARLWLERALPVPSPTGDTHGPPPSAEARRAVQASERLLARSPGAVFEQVYHLHHAVLLSGSGDAEGAVKELQLIVNNVDADTQILEKAAQALSGLTSHTQGTQ
jgi:tetratricopeptide (TPR) repeat protein